MLKDAISKIQTEMNQNANHPYIKAVGGMLLQHLEVNPGAAEQILAEGKTIKGSLKEMEKEARKKQVDGCAVLSDQEGFVVVLKYFGIAAGQAPVKTAASVAKHEPKPLPEKPADVFDVKLEDLL